MATTTKLKPMNFLFVNFSQSFFDFDDDLPSFEVRLTHSIPTTHNDDFVFKFYTLEEAREFTSCCISVSLFRNNRTYQKDFNEDFLLLAQKKYPELFLNNVCNLPIRPHKTKK